MGAIRTGGQGSVYKGRRTGEIICAVKLLPTPIHTEDKKDKNYRDYLNEVEKLKKVNEEPNPNVVKILSSGLTESGSFPFIEMEFIEGPDLQDLLEAPNDSVFSIHEVIKVADQLSNALAHCHKVEVKHGDIKSNNVKFNVYSGNYVLIDFGLAIMSDEQRRTSLRHAGAIEFMAPEQNEGHMLFQSDVYSFGVVLYELLAGTVPFPLNDKSETARNQVMVSHMETPVPDVMALRKKHIPKNWPDDKQEREMRVPEWLLGILSTCLEKKSSSRFASGVELHEAIIHSNALDTRSNEKLEGKNLVLQNENERLKSLLIQYQEQEENVEGISSMSYESTDNKNTVRISKPVFIVLLLLIFGLFAFAIYSMFGTDTKSVSSTIVPGMDSSSVDTNTQVSQPEARIKNNHNDEITALIDSVIKSDNATDSATTEPDEGTVADPGSEINTDQPQTNPDSPAGQNQRAGKYTLAVQRAYFYDNPTENTRRNTFLANWNKAELTALEDRNGFIYVMFFTDNGQVTKGWLRKRDLRMIGN